MYPVQKEPNNCSVVTLKQWLECHGLKRTGKKCELVERVIISHGVVSVDTKVDGAKWYDIKRQDQRSTLAQPVNVSVSGKQKSSFRFPGQKKVAFVTLKTAMQSATSVDEWLPNEYKDYSELFRKHGYDDISFIAGFIKEKDLQDIGISNRGHRKRLLIAIESLPPDEFLQEVPNDVEEWLLRLGLDQYWPRFYENSYTEPRDLADIKYMGHETISSIFKISKTAHLKKLIKATASLQYPTKAQKLIRDARKAVMAEPTKSMKAHNGDDGEEYEFWMELREICLLPEQAAFNQSGELVEKLSDMRDSCMLVLAIANVLWLTFMVAVMAQESLNVLGTSFASVAFLFVYTLVLVLQFLSLLWHRFTTVIHFIARAPFKPGHLKSNWAWRDKDLPSPIDPKVLDEIRERQHRRMQSSTYSSDNDEEIQTTWLTEPLVRTRRREQDMI